MGGLTKESSFLPDQNLEMTCLDHLERERTYFEHQIDRLAVQERHHFAQVVVLVRLQAGQHFGIGRNCLETC